MIVQNDIHDGFFMSIYNTENHKLYGRYILEGRGENEFLSLSMSNKYEIDSSGVKIWLNTAPQRNLILFNITKSIQENRTIIDKRIEIKDYALKGVYEWTYINDSILIGFVQGPIGKQIIKYNPMQDSVLNRFDVYEKSSSDFSLFFGLFQVKPDGEKVVNSMLYFNQLNFYSFGASESFSISTNKKIVDSKLIESINANDRINYYSDLWSNNNIIIASYYGDKSKLHCTEFHVFDWNGKLKKILNTKHKFKEFVIDERNADLYLYGVEEKIYKINLRDKINF